jgi:uncharacterized protein
MDAKPATIRHTRCPTCRQRIDVVAGAPRPSWAPFCSERCKLVDLGRWIGGDHAIPGEPVDPGMLEE